MKVTLEGEFHGIIGEFINQLRAHSKDPILQLLLTLCDGMGWDDLRVHTFYETCNCTCAEKRYEYSRVTRLLKMTCL